MSLQPPSTRLPPIRKIASQPTEELSDALAYLRHIYIPEVRGARRIKLNDTDSPSSSKALDPNGLHELRADAFERSYALRWLTALVAQAEIWDLESNTNRSSQSALREALIEDAASLLAICSGTAAAGVIVRDFVFRHGPKGENTLKVHIKDVPLDNRDYGSVGAQTWGGACVLSETILDDPARFGLLRNGNLRILELGAGTGLVSLTVGKLLQNAAPPQQIATIIATDYYPSVLENLDSNIQANFPSHLDSEAVRISSHLLDWSVVAKEPAQNPPFDAPFDLVLGADIIYEAQHAIWIKSCLMTLLQKPSQHSDPLFHLIIPLRSTHSSESGTVDSVFSHMSGDAASGSEMMDLKIVEKETILCDAGSGLGPDQIEYAYYKIGWR